MKEFIKKIFSSKKQEVRVSRDILEKGIYPVPKENPSDFFLMARNWVGSMLQKEMTKLPEGFSKRGAYWIKAEYTTTAFEDLTFAYKNQIFCILVEFIDKKTGQSLLPIQKIERLINESKKNNLIPCLYKVQILDLEKKLDIENLKKFSKGWNLYHAETQLKVIPEKIVTDELVPMSDWEKNDFAIQVVKDYLKQQNYKLLSYQNVVGIDPQIWFENEEGQQCWILVRYSVFPNDSSKKPTNMFDVVNYCKGFSGFFADVSFYSTEGNPSILFRGRGSYIKFTGLEKLTK